MTYDPQRGCGELQKWAWECVVGKKRDQIHNAERLPLSCLLKVIMKMIRGADKAIFCNREEVEAPGMAWQQLCVYLGEY